MAEHLPRIYLARHGETPWTVTHQHTGRTDIPLIPKGEADALKIGRRLENISFAKVYSSPLQRALKTCQSSQALKMPSKLIPTSWNGITGNMKGSTTKEIRAKNPDWDIFKDGCPGGESPEQIGARADHAIGRLRSISGNVLVFSHAHFLRVLATRWLGLAVKEARCFLLGTSSLSILGYEHNQNESVICLWNDVDYLRATRLLKAEDKP